MSRRSVLGLLLVAALLAAPGPSGAGELPVTGAHLALAASDGPRAARLQWSLVSPGLRPGELDPRQGAALRVGTSSAPGRCRIAHRLDPTRWHPLGLGRRVLAWLYLEAGPDGWLLALVLRGAVHGVAAGPLADCALAEPQPLPLAVELRLGGERVCAAFGGDVARNGAGAFRARAAPAPDACPDADLTVVDQNVLHGIACGTDTEQCRLADRIALLFDWIEAAGCPDVVTLQEVAELENFVPISVRQTIEAELPRRCPFAYHVVFEPVTGFDEELVLSRYPVLESEVRVLHLGFPAPGRHVTRVRIDHPIGAVEVFTTHLASGSDRAGSPCSNFFGGPCPAACVAAGAATVRECQSVQLAGFVTERVAGDAPAIVSGDLNAPPDSFEVAQLGAAGWIDSFLAAGNAECDPATGSGCTSGREDESLAELESPASNETERIDYVFVVPPGPASTCAARLDGPDDDDGDGTATRVFGAEPNPFAPGCGPAPEAICWPSDHEGAELDLDCAP